jgi:DNA-binding transcriptional ArsR family regulator
MVCVITIALTADDLTRIRFAFSPLWETVTSVRAVATGAPGLHRPWLHRVGPVLDGPDLELLRALVTPFGYFPDFLTPPPPRRSTGFDAAVAMVAATPADLVAHELAKLARDWPSETLDTLQADPGKALVRITEALRSYWRRVIEADWPRIRALHTDDLAYRLDELAAGGVHRLFRTLHPSVAFNGKIIRIDRPYSCDESPQPGQGLLLVPCVFAWPMALVTGAPHVPTLTYPPRGIGRLWEFRPDTDGSPLADLVGKTRAAIVGLLDLPMTTTQLACQLNLTPPTLSAHLGVLRAAGVVDSRRDGRAVLYSRTGLGDHLLDGARPTAVSA